MLEEVCVCVHPHSFCPAGLDTAHTSMLKEVASQRRVNNRTFTFVHLMYLSDSHHLLPEEKIPRYDPNSFTSEEFCT